MQARREGRRTRPFSEIRRPETPERRARIDAMKDAMKDAERLHAIRQALGVTQVQVAERLGKSQGSVSELERRDDVYLSTLREYIEALGGQLYIAAVFEGDRSYGIALGEAVAEEADIAAG